jgi:hypothetical protein
VLPQGENPFYIVDALQYTCEVSGTTYMPQVIANFAGLGDSQYLIDNNAAIGYVWTTDCSQTQAVTNMSTPVACSDAPSYVNETLDESSTSGGGPYTDAVDGGYTTSGNNIRASLSMTDVSDTEFSTNLNMHAVEEISGNAWQYNTIGQASGSLAFGLGSQWIDAMEDSTTGVSQWCIQVGQVADQSYAGDSNYVYAGNSSTLYMGPGSFKNIWTGTSKDSITLYTNEDNTYNMFSIAFGQDTGDTDTTGYIPLVWGGSTSQVTIALNFQGIGLPWYQWNQVVNLLSRSGPNTYDKLVCNSEENGYCTLPNACDSSEYVSLWDYYFNIQFDVQSQIFTTVNFGSFAVTNTTDNTCNLYVQVLHEN